MPTMRLQKFIAHSGVCSRRQAENLIREGRVSVNGKKVEEMGVSVDPDKDRVKVDGKPIQEEERKYYIAVNKPRGWVSSCSHPGQKLVIDLVDLPARLYPVGRLDKDSTGLLLLTNDGELHQHLSHPSFEHEKEYLVRSEKPLTDDDLEQLANGVELKGKRTCEASVWRMGPEAFRIVLKEGRNRQIKRMVETLGNKVTAIHRVRVGTVNLEGLAPGKWRYLNSKEKRELFRLVRMPKKKFTRPEATPKEERKPRAAARRGRSSRAPSRSGRDSGSTYRRERDPETPARRGRKPAGPAKRGRKPETSPRKRRG